MLWYYVGSLILGSVFVVPLLLGGIGGDADLDFGSDVDADLDLSLDGDVDADVDADGGASLDADSSVGFGDFITGMVSVRSVAFFLTFFGLTGTVLTTMSYNTGLVLAIAIGLGLISAGLNSAAFTMLKAAQNTSHISSADIEGRPGRIVVPIEPGRRGRIRVDLGGQPQYMVAAGYKGTESLLVGQSVVVVSVANGVAEVAAMEDLDLGDDDQPPMLER